MISLLVSLFLLQSPILADAQKMAEVRDKIAVKIVEVDVELPPLKGTDQSFWRTMQGQAACVLDGKGKVRMLTSKFLVDGARKVRVRNKDHPKWVDAKVVSTNEKLAIAFLEPKEDKPFPCLESKLAPSGSASAYSVVISIDNPATYPNLFWGQLVSTAEPPMSAFLLTATGLSIGYPLYSLEGKLTAINLRRYTPTSEFFLAVSCAQLRHLFKPAEKRKTNTAR